MEEDLDKDEMERFEKLMERMIKEGKIDAG